MSNHHHHQHAPAASQNVLGFDELQQQFGESQENVDSNGPEAPAEAMLAEMAQITEYQWRHSARRGLVKGFLLSGPPGVGKTTQGKRLAYELGRRFSEGADSSEVKLIFVDGSEIARARYGESEERIRQIFQSAQHSESDTPQRTVLLFDDVESILMARGSEHAKEWHFSQDSVFFHAVDDLDSTSTVLVLTTNRADLVDEAIRDRFLHYRFDLPTADALLRVALSNAREHSFTDEEEELLRARVTQWATDGEPRSLRDVERLVLQVHVERALGRPSLALER